MAKSRRPLNKTLSETLDAIQTIKEASADEDREIDFAELSAYGKGGKTQEPKLTPEKIEQVLSLTLNLEGNESVIPEVLKDQQLKPANALMIPLEQLRPNKIHSRYIEDESAMEILKDSILKNGVLQPILVRPLSQGNSPYQYSYEIVAGFRRYKACYELGMETIPAVVKDIEPEFTTIIGMIENLVRKDTQAIEETYAILQLLREVTGKSQEDIIVNLSRIYREQLGQTKPVALNTDDGQIIAKIFDILPVSLGSFITNRIKLLSINEEILEAIIENQIGASSGVLIDSSLPDEDLKIGLLKEAIANNYSRQKIQARINEIRCEHYDDAPKRLKYELIDTVKTLVSSGVWDTEDKRYFNKLEKLRDEMMEIIEVMRTKKEQKKLSGKKSRNKG